MTQHLLSNDHYRRRVRKLGVNSRQQLHTVLDR